MCATCGCGEDATPVYSLEVPGLEMPGAQAHDHSRDPGHTRTRDGHPPSHPHTPDHSHNHTHSHLHDQDHDHPDGHAQTPELTLLEQHLLAKNDLLAERNRGWLAGRKVRALNMMSSPGSGKTTLLVRTLTELGDRLQAGVIEGDQETCLDADRIRKAGRPVVQINTGAGAR